MAFDPELPRTAVSIQDISIELVDLKNPGLDPNGDPITPYGARYNVQIVMSDGSIVVRQGNLVPHITTAQRNSLIAFMQAMRTQAETQFLAAP